uniref:Uncharacterized protein n=1 Tax=Anguilla anguilla TaxID=7936 RepID=A0A0E9PDS0_ANGAN
MVNVSDQVWKHSPVRGLIIYLCL